jgi:hypothetical protein
LPDAAKALLRAALALGPWRQELGKQQLVATVGTSMSPADKPAGTRADFNVTPDFGTIELVRA